MTLELDRIRREVQAALDEDIGPGDPSAALISPGKHCTAELITREAGVLAGRHWAELAFSLCDEGIRVHWLADDGQPLEAGQTLAHIEGSAQGILAAERTALNFLQLLSGVATRTRDYVAAVAGTGTRILDTRKTVPGLRLAQKYAVRCGGGHNHRLGLFDMIMLKENHITAAGGVSNAVRTARDRFPTLAVEVEVETLDEFDQALAAKADRILLDNFPLDALREAVNRNQGQCTLEASGGITLATLPDMARTGVDDLSVGELTKRISPLDLSLRVLS